MLYIPYDDIVTFRDYVINFLQGKSIDINPEELRNFYDFKSIVNWLNINAKKHNKQILSMYKKSISEENKKEYKELSQRLNNLTQQYSDSGDNETLKQINELKDRMDNLYKDKLDKKSDYNKGYDETDENEIKKKLDYPYYKFMYIKRIKYDEKNNSLLASTNKEDFYDNKEYFYNSDLTKYVNFLNNRVEYYKMFGEENVKKAIETPNQWITLVDKLDKKSINEEHLKEDHDRFEKIDDKADEIKGEIDELEKDDKTLEKKSFHYKGYDIETEQPGGNLVIYIYKGVDLITEIDNLEAKENGIKQAKEFVDSELSKSAKLKKKADSYSTGNARVISKGFDFYDLISDQKFKEIVRTTPDEMQRYDKCKERVQEMLMDEGEDDFSISDIYDRELSEDGNQIQQAIEHLKIDEEDEKMEYTSLKKKYSNLVGEEELIEVEPELDNSLNFDEEIISEPEPEQETIDPNQAKEVISDQLKELFLKNYKNHYTYDNIFKCVTEAGLGELDRYDLINYMNDLAVTVKLPRIGWDNYFPEEELDYKGFADHNNHITFNEDDTPNMEEISEQFDNEPVDLYEIDRILEERIKHFTELNPVINESVDIVRRSLKNLKRKNATVIKYKLNNIIVKKADNSGKVVEGEIKYQIRLQGKENKKNIKEIEISLPIRSKKVELPKQFLYNQKNYPLQNYYINDIMEK